MEKGNADSGSTVTGGAGGTPSGASVQVGPGGGGDIVSSPGPRTAERPRARNIATTGKTARSWEQVSKLEEAAFKKLPQGFTADWRNPDRWYAINGSDTLVWNGSDWVKPIGGIGSDPPPGR